MKTYICEKYTYNPFRLSPEYQIQKGETILAIHECSLSTLECVAIERLNYQGENSGQRFVYITKSDFINNFKDA